MTPKCKHTNAAHVMPGDIRVQRHPRAHIIVSHEQFRCLDCGAWLSLGPSNDEPAEVQVEIRAAELAADLADDTTARWYMDRGAVASDEGYGWFFHDRYISANDGFAGHILSAAGRAGYLARAIATHTDPLTLDEVKSALAVGAEERKAAEQTMKRSPRR